jgi:starch synthase
MWFAVGRVLSRLVTRLVSVGLAILVPLAPQVARAAGRHAEHVHSARRRAGGKEGRREPLSAAEFARGRTLLATGAKPAPSRHAASLSGDQQPSPGSHTPRPHPQTPDRTEIEKALDHLDALVDEYTQVHDLDVDALAEQLSLEEAARVRHVFDELHRLRDQGDLFCASEATTIDRHALLRLTRGDLSEEERKHLTGIALRELYQLFPGKRDRGFRRRLAHRFAAHGQTPPQIQESEVLDDGIPLHQQARRKARALAALLMMPGLSPALTLASIARLGAVGEAEEVPHLEALAHHAPEYEKAVDHAVAEIQRGAQLGVAFATYELTPLAWSGGLGNVMKELSQALRRMGHLPAIFLPRYTFIERDTLNDLGIREWVDEPDGPPEPFQLLYTYLEDVGEDVGEDLPDEPRPRVPVFLIENGKYFSDNRPGSPSRHGIYGDAHGPYGDNDRRSFFFAAAVVKAILAVHARAPHLLARIPDIVQFNEAQTAPGVHALRLAALAPDSPYRDTASIYTIHNLGLAYQERFDGERARQLPLGDLAIQDGPAMIGNQLVLSKIGITQADGVVTVSPGYRRETISPGSGTGLEEVLQRRHGEGRYVGILNGIDDSSWNPAANPLIDHRFSYANRAGKQAARRALRERFSLARKPELPLFVLIGRLTEQKGHVDAFAAIDALLSTGKQAQFVVVGDGDGTLVAQVQALAARYPDLVAYTGWGGEKLERMLYAGADYLLMPSIFEPSGLPPMYASRSLVVSLVRAVGGLRDMIRPWDPERGTGNGFWFLGGPDHLRDAIAAMIDLFSDDMALGRLQRNAALSPFDWLHTAAPDYVTYYRLVLDDLRRSRRSR